jgi:rubrerythrin
MVTERLKDFTNQIMSCSNLEEETFRFYRNVARKMDSPELRSLIVSISYDSLKHFMAIKEIIRTIEKQEFKPENLSKPITELLEEITEVSKQISEASYLNTEEFLDIFKASIELEDRLAEIYLSMFTPKILETAAFELDPRGEINMKNLAKIFEDIVEDKQMHRETLFDISYAYASKEQQAKNTAPFVRYTNPDRWSPPQTS